MLISITSAKQALFRDQMSGKKEAPKIMVDMGSWTRLVYTQKKIGILMKRKTIWIVSHPK